MDHKSFPFEIKEFDDAGGFSGYASVFGNIDDGGDIILPGAFKKTIMERFSRIKVCWQHDWKQPIGKPLEMYEDEHGLFVKAIISDTSLGRDVRALMRDGVVSELSIGYDVIKDTWQDIAGRKARVLQELRLYEVSPVTIAMNSQAVITGVKSAPLETLVAQLTDATDEEIDEAIQALKAIRAVAEPPPVALTTPNKKRLALKLKLLEVSL